jgi:hypothetical protein
MTRRRRAEQERCIYCGGAAMAMRATGTHPLPEEEKAAIERRARDAMLRNGKCVVVPVSDGRVLQLLLGVCMIRRPESTSKS